MKRALITGITGQDGSYLAELLIGKGYEVHGLIRRASTFNTERIDHLYADPHDQDAKLRLHFADLTDGGSLTAVVGAVQPDEVYNLGAQSHVRVSFDQPIYTGDVSGLGAARMLEAVRTAAPNARYYQASSSEMYGNALQSPQSERTPFRPCSPYGCAKLYAHEMTRHYREAYGMHASCGILFNHESPRRGETFVTRKITRAVGRIKYGLQDKLYLGNVDAWRDWGFAGDYVRAMWAMLQENRPDDYVVATGEQHSVREFADLAFCTVGLRMCDYVRHDDRYNRPSELHSLVGNARRASDVLGWKLAVDFETLVRMMVASDMVLAKREAAAKNA